jgi:iron(III) transport system substrate-binding protein
MKGRSMTRIRLNQGDVPDPAVSRTSHRLRWAAPAAALTLLASACGSSTSPSTGSASNTKVPLVIYAAEGYDSAVAKAFQQATGIPTSVYDAHTGIVVSKIEQEKNNPRWGVTWFDGDMAMASLDQQGLLLKGYQPKAAFNPRGLEFLPKDQSYTPTGYTIAATILYNSTAMPNPPSAWTDLLAPAYKGKVGILNPAIDGSAYPMMAGWATQFGGVQQLQDYVTAVVKNGARVFTSPDDELNAIKQGSIDVAFAQSSYGIGVGETQPNLKLAYPQFVTPMPSILGIAAKAPAAVQAEAKQFVEFVLSPEGQKAMQAGDAHGDSLYWPVVDGVSPRPEVPSPATIPTKTVDPYVWGAQENSISQWFTSHIAS